MEPPFVEYSRLGFVRFQSAVASYAAAVRKGDQPGVWRTADYLLGRAVGLGEVLFGYEIDATHEVAKLAEAVWAEMDAYDQV